MSIVEIADEIYKLKEKIVLIYAFNTTGKTRLSIAYKNATKSESRHTGVYYNAFSEDLFSWDNDIENDESNIRLMIKKSSLNKFHSLFTEEDVMKKLELYKPKYNFFFDYIDDDMEKGIEGIRFIVGQSEEDQEQIKISRGEERIFVWCLFLAMFEVEGWADEQNAHFFIDDPVSSLDDHNIFITATTLYALIEKHFEHRKIIITTHHIGIYSILSNWLTKGEKADKYKKNTKQLIVNRKEEGLQLEPIRKSIFLYHLHLLQTLDKANSENSLVTFHFALLRQVLENIASFLGVGQFSYVLNQIGIENEDEVSNILNVLAHEKVYRYQTEKMNPDNELLFNNILEKLKDKYQFVLRTE
ncbi:AAA family ATPase [Halobacteriovorax sp. JY17]|uniref:AAA family ATPase n=1 Tax=Halobacteriovorax sp. JY17 TaxID=2014617 RepID=UPI000C5DC2E4|nr:AAA family ATPase [Halobacteriovorax sp. JY17]PIK14394.1 MAG: anticodon nuclease [Halobacteriovorax sp. JY17]